MKAHRNGKFINILNSCPINFSDNIFAALLHIKNRDCVPTYHVQDRLWFCNACGSHR